MTKRVVLDTSVVASAFRSASGASSALMALLESRRFIMLASPALFLEYEEVLKRPEQRAASGLTLGEVDIALAAMGLLLEPVDVRFTWRPLLRDPDDEMVVEVAINGHADALVTHNVSDFRGFVEPFGLRVVRPGAFLTEMRE